MPNQPIIRRIDDSKPAAVANSQGATIQILLGPEDGMPVMYTRRFTIEPGGRIPLHRHDRIEHDQVVIEGEMILTLDGAEHTVSAGNAIYISVGTAHAYENRGKTPARFLCMVPAVKDYLTEWLEKAG